MCNGKPIVVVFVAITNIIDNIVTDNEQKIILLQISVVLTFWYLIFVAIILIIVICLI
jgi:hypothetical protein